MNVDEDLLILIEQKPHDLQDAIPLAPFRLHFYSLSRSISSLEPHPLAYRPIVEYPGDEDWWEYQVVFGMYGDHICLLLGSGQPAPCSYDRLVVWDWKQGGIAERRAEEEIFESFVLLEEGIILLPDVTNGRINLLLYRLSKPENDNPGGPNYQPGLFHILMIFKLPGLQVGLEWAYIQMRSQPSGQPRQGFGHIPRCSINSGKESVHRGTSNSDPTAEQSEPNPFSPFPAPFTSSIDDSIIVISTRVTPMEMGGGAQEQSLRDADGTLVVKRSLFRKWMKEAKPWAQTATIRYGAWTRYEVSLLSALSGDPTPEESSVHQPSEAPNPLPNRRPLEFMSASFPRYCTMPPPKMVQWNEWMYETRWLRGVGSPRWVRDVHGTRVVSRVMERTPLPPAPSLMEPYPTSPDQSAILTFLNSAASLYPMSSEDFSTMISAIGALPNDSSNPVVSTSSSLSTVTVSPGSSAPNASNDPPIPSHVQAPLGSPSSTSNQAQSLALSLIPTFASMAAAINSTSTQSISSGLATPMNSAVGMQATTHQTEQAQSTNDLTSPVSTPSVSSPQSTTPLAIPLPSLASLFTEIAIPLVLQNLPTAPTTPQPPLPANAAVFGPAVERSSHRTRIYDFNNAPYCRVPRSIPYPDCIKLDTSTSTSKTASDSSRSQICASQRKHEEKSRRRDNGWSIISPDDDGVWTRRPVWEETFIPPGTTYAEEICTRMPYLEITSTELNDCSALMIDTERIIQMKTDENGNLRCLEVFVM
ncbi:hypothetical protein CPB86DRAFT_71802 [Serendipita vermifera]|nr:hypothetical protein CPB86DRAFT_71802 [Serendipita vermifera]